MQQPRSINTIERHNQPIRSVFLLIVLSMFLTSCIRPYQPDIQQGNILNNNRIKELRAGMSKQEVLFILGTPMVIDPFNENRWDYFYSKRDSMKKKTTTRLVTAVFEGDKLVKLSGDVSLDQLANLEPSIEDKQHGGTVITEPTQKEKGFLNRLGLFKRKNP